MIPFNKPYLTGNETKYISESVISGKISGDGIFTKKCHNFFKAHFNFSSCLLTTSCTDALEMAAILCNIQPGDEVIMPSYTFVSTANAFALRGAKIIFADSKDGHPGINEDKIEQLITNKTKAIVPVHYAGVACDMDKIMALANKYNLFIIEDAAQAIDSYFTNSNGNTRPLGSFGHLSTFSFHETKNIISGEGGLLVINDQKLIERAEIIREKGTNRSKFFRGEIDKYGWVDIGSSFLPSDIIAAFLYAQLENLENIQTRRKTIWNIYRENLGGLQHKIRLPFIPDYATNNGHMFYIICNSENDRDKLITRLKENNFLSVFHYQSLHKSEYFKSKYSGEELDYSDLYSKQLLRLPFYYELEDEKINQICSVIKEYCLEV
jgi:dTDP-4-amino-4,6-dideoxygalactose transaminase